MPSVRPDRLSYVRVVREVVQTERLDQFNSELRDIAKDTLGYKNSASYKTPTKLEEQLRPDYRPQVRNIGVLAADILPVNAWKIKEFEYGLPRSQRTNSKLQRLGNRLSKVDVRQLDHADRLQRAAVGFMIDSTIDSPETGHHPIFRTFSMVLKENETTDLFYAERDAYYKEAAEPAGPRVKPIIPDYKVEPILVDVLRIPYRTPAENIGSFVETFNDYVGAAAVALAFEEPEIVQALRS